MTETNDQPVADLRRNLRSPLIVQKVHTDAERPVFFGYSKSFSRSGMFIATTNPIGPGEQIDLEIPLPTALNQTVRCRCEVVWKRAPSKRLPFEPGMGLKFLNMPEEISIQLDTWIVEQNEQSQQ